MSFIMKKDKQEQDVDFEVNKRILEGGMKAPSWSHCRNWPFIVHEKLGVPKRWMPQSFGYPKNDELG